MFNRVSEMLGRIGRQEVFAVKKWRNIANTDMSTDMLVNPVDNLANLRLGLAV